MPSCFQGRLDPYLVDPDEGDADQEDSDEDTGETMPDSPDGPGRPRQRGVVMKSVNQL